MTIVRLGQGVDRTGRLAPEALERTFAACREYAAAIKEHGAERLRFVATSASRDAENRDEFVRGVLDILGVEPEVVTGDQEARALLHRRDQGTRRARRPRQALSGRGHRRRLDRVRRRRRPGARGPVGGHRLRTDDRAAPASGTGSVLDPPAEEQIAAVRADIEAALDLAEQSVPLGEARTLVGLAGSVTTVSAIALGLDAYDSEAIHHSRISYDQVREITETAAPVHPRRARGDPVDAPGTGRRDRRGGAGAAVDHGADRGGGGRRQRARHPGRDRLVGGLGLVRYRSVASAEQVG